jgi:hypothetical protein
LLRVFSQISGFCDDQRSCNWYFGGARQTALTSGSQTICEIGSTLANAGIINQRAETALFTGSLATPLTRARVNLCLQRGFIELFWVVRIKIKRQQAQYQAKFRCNLLEPST